jgi:redox-sensing transcriptional repressor
MFLDKKFSIRRAGMEKHILSVPEPTLRRIPQYHHYLRGILANGQTGVSCTHIGAELRLDPTQVRKDLAYTGIVGRPKTGYDVNELITAIEEFLGWNNLTDAFLVGVGSLGTALVGYAGFKNYGLNIIAAFDTNPAKQCESFFGIPVFPVTKLPNLAKRMKIQIGIITVPAEGAQEAANQLIKGGICGIWNFAPVNLQVPPDVIVQNENLASGLAILSKKMAQYHQP